jgi:hypothetical protein
MVMLPNSLRSMRVAYPPCGGRLSLQDGSYTPLHSRRKAFLIAFPRIRIDPGQTSQERLVVVTVQSQLLHKRRCPLEFTTLYSNNGASVEFGRVKDWIVMHVHAAGQTGMQRMVITKTRGPLGGQCVVCSREMTCRQHSGVAQ